MLYETKSLLMLNSNISFREVHRQENNI